MIAPSLSSSPRPSPPNTFLLAIPIERQVTVTYYEYVQSANCGHTAFSDSRRLNDLCIRKPA
jgi:hypothetical protein